MNIAIIGAGFTGLTAAIELQKEGHTVTIFEKESIPGGLAMGFQGEGWEWPLEKHYHHIFTSDSAIRRISEEVGVPFTFLRPNTSSLIDGEMYQLDSPVALLLFPKLSLTDRIRMGAVLAYLKCAPSWKPFEEVTAAQWLPKMMGKKGYETVWEPLLTAKFGSYASKIALAWFWARIKARSTQLGYPEGGFQSLAEAMSHKVMSQGGRIYYSTTIQQIKKQGSQVEIVAQDGSHAFDKVIVTLPNNAVARLIPDLPEDYKKKLLDFEGIGAVTMVLELDAPLLKNSVYWLNVNEKGFPFLAVVEHTNLIDKGHYNNRHIVYIANYLPHDHKYFSFTPEQLMNEYDAHLKKLNPDYRQHVLNTHIFQVPFAQPIIPLHYSEKVLPLSTPVEGVYVANMQQVYPWDRGTNYAVELGERVAGAVGE